MRLLYSRTAARDLKQIQDFIAQDDPSAADRVVGRIERALLLLAEFPEAGHVGVLPETRELVVSGLKYRIVYRVEATCVRILTVIHTARQWP